MKLHFVDQMDEVLQIALEWPLPEPIESPQLPLSQQPPAPPSAHQQQ